MQKQITKTKEKVNIMMVNNNQLEMYYIFTKITLKLVKGLMLVKLMFQYISFHTA